MLSTIHKPLIICCLLAASLSSYAADYDVEVCSLQSHDVIDIVYMGVCGGWTSKNSCNAGGYIAWDMSKFQGKAMYSTALAALTAGKRVRVRLNGQTCHGSYDATYMIRILK